MRIAINGFGRIGRTVYRILAENNIHEIVAINDLSEPGALAYLLKYDTVMGRFDGEVHFGKWISDYCGSKGEITK